MQSHSNPQDTSRMQPVFFSFSFSFFFFFPEYSINSLFPFRIVFVPLWNLKPSHHHPHFSWHSGLPDSNHNGSLSAAYSILEFLKHKLQPLLLSSHKSVPKAYELYNFTLATAPFLGANFFFDQTPNRATLKREGLSYSLRRSSPSGWLKHSAGSMRWVVTLHLYQRLHKI